MTIAAILLAVALQAAAPASPPEVDPAVLRAGRAWAECTKRVIDSTIGNRGVSDEALADGAFAGCTAEEAVLRGEVARALGPDQVEPFMLLVTGNARTTILDYLRRTRRR